MLWWLSVAPFGKPVVPLVYWMLIGSSKSSVGGSDSRIDRRAAGARSSSQSGVAEEDHVLELGQVAGRTSSDHRDVVGLLELGRGDQHPAAGLAQRVLQLRACGRPG